MPQSEAKFQINQFTGGLNTDANPLADTGPISRDELNCEIMSHGGRRRRRACDTEFGATDHTTTFTSSNREDWAFGVDEWANVGGVNNLNFAVYQQGDKLWFYEKGSSSLSVGLKTFSVDLQSFKTTTASSTQVQNTRVSVATGKGVIFVCGAHIEPFYVEYNETLDTITTTQVTIQIRDFEELEDGIGIKQEVDIAATPNNGNHLYNLLNQGWYQTGMFLRNEGSSNKDGTAPAIELYRSVTGFFPRKNTPWHFGKYLVPEDSSTESNAYLSPQQVQSAPSGNELAPRGHYILDAFNKDRQQVVIDAGDDLTGTFAYYVRLDALVPEVEDERPVAVAFYAGRVWWALNNNVYFSQLLDDDDVSAAGKCYQDGDPTSEGTSDVVATDGGLIPVSGMGRATALAVTGTHLVVLADNGVWSISGAAGDSFTAVDFSVNRLSTVECRSPHSVVEAEGFVMFMGDHGIYTVSPSDTLEQAAIQDLVEGRITEFYNNIPTASLRNASGVYDPVNKVVHWMYKETTDANGTSKNRFAYDKFLNFSLKFNAFFPWKVDALAARQISGATISTGLATTTGSENVTDSSLADVTDSSFNTVTVTTTTEVEQRTALKVLVLKETAATWGEFFKLTFEDWDDGTNDTDYSSYIETFYHIQDDYMAYMQAPYVYAYFRRTEEAPTPIVTGAALYDQVNPGGLTFNSTFIHELYKAAPTTNERPPRLAPLAPFIIGEDDNRYQFEHGGSGTGANEFVITLYNVDTGTDLWSRTSSEINSDLVGIGVEPPSGGYLTTGGSLSCFPIPSTPYFIVILSTSAGVDVSKGVAYYRINSDSSVSIVGGLSGKGGDVSGPDVDQQSPIHDNASSISGFGFVNSFATNLPDANSRATAQNNKVFYQYPICFTHFSETRSTVSVIPSINEAVDTVILGNVDREDWWADHEDNLATPLDANVLELEGHPLAARNRNRAFFLPNSSNGNVFFKWYQRDIDEHIAGSEPITSTFLQTHDSTYPSGFVTSVPLTLTEGGNTPFGFTSALGTALVQADANWTGFPFTDETDDFDETSGTSTNNFSSPPACFPLYEDDIDGPWLMFFPKVFRNQSQSDKIMIKVMLYDPTTNEAKLLDSQVGSIVDFSSDTTDTSGHDPEQVSVYWDRTNGDLLVQVFYDNNNAESLVTSKWGTYTPQISGVDFFATGTTTLLESSCLLNTRWEWSNNTNSGKISNDIQVYRGGRVQPVTDPTNPEPTGLPVYVSKTKTRGRGRALQLRFRSETGKDFELYGWAVWGGKNTRF